MAEKDSTTKKPEQWEWLADLFTRVLWPLDGFIRTLDGDHNAHEDLMAVLIPLVDRMKADLDIIDEVLAESFGGRIKIETTDHLKTFKAFEREGFKKAFVVKQALAAVLNLNPVEALDSPEAH